MASTYALNSINQNCLRFHESIALLRKIVKSCTPNCNQPKLVLRLAFWCSTVLNISLQQRPCPWTKTTIVLNFGSWDLNETPIMQAPNGHHPLLIQVVLSICVFSFAPLPHLQRHPCSAQSMFFMHFIKGCWPWMHPLKFYATQDNTIVPPPSSTWTPQSTHMPCGTFTVCPNHPCPPMTPSSWICVAEHCQPIMTRDDNNMLACNNSPD